MAAAAPLPDWFLAMRQHSADAARELETDVAAIVARWNARAAAIPRTDIGYPDITHLFNEAGARNLIGFVRSPRSQRTFDERAAVATRTWMQGAIDGLDRDMPVWRSCRSRIDAAIDTWLAALTAVQAAKTALEDDGQQLHDASDDNARLAAQDRFDAAQTTTHARRVAAWVANTRLVRLTACLNLPTFMFYDYYEAGLVGRIEGRVPYAAAFARYDAALSRLEEAALQWTKQAVDADTDSYATMAETLQRAAVQIAAAWSWEGIDVPPAELVRMESVADDAARKVAALAPKAQDEAHRLQRRHELNRQLTAQYKTPWSSEAAAEALRAKQDAEQKEIQAIDRDNAATDQSIRALRDQRWIEPPITRLRALLASLQPERAVDRRLPLPPDRAASTGPFSVGDGPLGRPNPIQIALGVPLAITTIGCLPEGLATPGACRLSGTAEAGAGSRPLVMITYAGFWAVSYVRPPNPLPPDTRIVLVSPAAEPILNAAPPPAPAPTALPPRSTTVAAPANTTPVSPLAGHWNVAYFDGALGWVRGEAEIAEDGLSADIRLTDPRTGSVFPLTAAVTRSADGATALEYRGQQPHLDARLGPPVERFTYIGYPDLWSVKRPAGSPLESTPPLPPGLPLLPVAAAATELHVSVGAERATFKISSAVSPESMPLRARLLPIDTKRYGSGFTDAFGIVHAGVNPDESMQGFWEQPVDPATRQPPDSLSRYRLLERELDNPNRARQVGIEIWWRGPPATIALLAQTVAGPIKVSRLFQNVPTVIEAVFDEPQQDVTKDMTVTIDGRDLKLTAARDPQEYRRFVSPPLIPDTTGAAR
jgi:hypothetical protein